MPSKVIVIANQKGGTGKTTTSINLGSSLSKFKKKVLLIDLDPQANLSYSLGITSPSLSIANVLAGEVEFKDIIQERNGLYVAPAAGDLADIEISLVSQENREVFLMERLKKLKDFDYIIIDAPPSVSLLTLNALNAASEVIIPLQPEVLSIQGLAQVLSTIAKVKSIYNPKLKVKGIVLVMFDQRRNLSAELLEYLKENIREKIFDARIRLNVKIAEAPSFGQSVIDYAPSSTGAKDYLSVAKEYLALK